MGYYRAGGTAVQRSDGMMVSHTPAQLAGSSSSAAVDDEPGPRTYRRMNPGNTRALRRAMRRVQSFAKLARSTVAFTHRVKMKKHRRR